MHLFHPFYLFSCNIDAMYKCLKNQPFNHAMTSFSHVFSRIHCFILKIHFLCIDAICNIDAKNAMYKCLKNQPFNQGFFLIIAPMFYPFYPFSCNIDAKNAMYKCLKNQPFNQGLYLIIASMFYPFYPFSYRCQKCHV